MFFLPIAQLTEYSEEQRIQVDALLVSSYQKNGFLTPYTFVRMLSMSEEEGWELLFKLTEIGAIYRVNGSICTNCGKQFVRRKPCVCKGEVRLGYYWRVRAS